MNLSSFSNVSVICKPTGCQLADALNLPHCLCQLVCATKQHSCTAEPPGGTHLLDLRQSLVPCARECLPGHGTERELGHDRIATRGIRQGLMHGLELCPKRIEHLLGAGVDLDVDLAGRARRASGQGRLQETGKQLQVPVPHL